MPVNVFTAFCTTASTFCIFLKCEVHFALLISRGNEGEHVGIIWKRACLADMREMCCFPF